MCNGQTERMNRTIINILRTLLENYKSDWRHVNKLTHAYNSTVNKTTGYSPHYLMFGREPIIPIDLLFESSNQCNHEQSRTSFIREWEDKMRDAYKVVKERTNQVGDCSNKLKVGDKVFVRNKSERGGTGKLRSFWEKIFMNRRSPSRPTNLSCEINA